MKSESHSVVSGSFDPMDCSPSGSSVHGILQIRILEWVAIPFSRESSQSRDWTWVSCTARRFFTIVTITTHRLHILHIIVVFWRVQALWMAYLHVNYNQTKLGSGWKERTLAHVHMALELHDSWDWRKAKEDQHLDSKTSSQFPGR